MSAASEAYLKRLLEPFIEGWMNENLETKLWTPDEFKQKFSQRSVHQLLQDKDTSFMGACLDRTLLTQWYLQLAGRKPELFMEHLHDHNNGREGLHYFLRDGNQIIDFRDRTNVIIKPTPYQNPQDVTTKGTWPMHGELDPKKNFFENYWHEPPVKEFYRLLEEHINGLLKDNTPERFARYHKEIEHQPNLTIHTTQTYINLH
ncbi:MAG: hypothetical protein ACLFO2_00615 [Candidatus Woesearchaeota archaeon]